MSLPCPPSHSSRHVFEASSQSERGASSLARHWHIILARCFSASEVSVRGAGSYTALPSLTQPSWWFQPSHSSPTHASSLVAAPSGSSHPDVCANLGLYHCRACWCMLYMANGQSSRVCSASLGRGPSKVMRLGLRWPVVPSLLS